MALLDNLLRSKRVRPASEEERSAEKSLIRKINLRIIPILGLLYGLVFLNRNNIATVAGAAGKLQLDYSVHLFASNGLGKTAIIFQLAYGVPAIFWNQFLLWFEPRIWLGVVMFFTGALGACSGAPTTFSGLAPIRFFLGVFEGAFFPGAIYLISRWYRRDYLGLAVAVFYSGAAALATVGNTLAAAITKLSKTGNRDGWAWVSIIEGLATLVLLTCIFWLPRVPEITGRQRQETPPPSDNDNTNVYLQTNENEVKAASTSSIDRLSLRGRQFLSTNEKRTFESWVTREDEWRSIPENLRPGYWRRAFKDPKTYMWIPLNISAVLPRDGAIISLPSIVNSLNINTSYSGHILLTAPPYVAAFFFTVFMGWISDRLRARGIVNMISSAFLILGLIILTATKNPNACYAGSFFAMMGGFSVGANGLTWTANNTEGYSKRAIVLGLAVGSANTCTVLNPAVWYFDTAENKWILYPILLAISAINFIISLGIHIYLKKKNVEKQLRLDNLSYTPRSAVSEDYDMEGDLSPELKYYE